MDTGFLSTVLLHFTLGIAFFVLAIRILSAYIPPSRISNRCLGIAFGTALSVFFSYKYMGIFERFFEASSSFKTMLFLIGLVFNFAIVLKIFSAKNKSRVPERRPYEQFKPAPRTTKPIYRIERQGRENLPNPGPRLRPPRTELELRRHNR